MPSPTRSSTARQAGTLGPVSRRARLVWGSLMAAMTGVGGLLFILDRAPAGRAQPLALPPLLASGTQTSIGTIFDTRAPLDRSRWTSIVIHHSGSTAGTPATLDAQARSAGLKGVGYHFVIGNGDGMEDGRLHVTRRWLEQSPGAHVAGKSMDAYNLHSIGICLVGDGERREFTPAQTDRLVELVDALCRELNVPRDRVYLHRDLARTADPGRLFPEATIREELAARR